MPTRNGSAEWRGDLQDGDGTLKVGESSYEGPYTFKSRFEEGEGTNPEELIGAAQAACYSMQLSAMLANDGHTPESVNTGREGPPAHGRRHADDHAHRARDRGQGPRTSTRTTFQDTAAKAKETCLVSRALAGVDEIKLSAKLA